MVDRLLVDLDPDGQVTVAAWPDGGLPEILSRAPFEWPLGAEMLEDLRWYLEDYLRSPFGVWQDRGPQIQARLADWGDAVFASVFPPGPARDAYLRFRDQGLELLFRSPSAGMLALPWELMRDADGPAALVLAGVSRTLPAADLADPTVVPAGRLRVLMVISRPAGPADVGYRMVARPLLNRLRAVRGEVDLVVLRPPTLGALRSTLVEAVEKGEPFQVVHFDGHGVMARQPSRAGSALPPLTFSPRRESSISVSAIPSGAVSASPTRIIDQPSTGVEGEGFLEFEAPGGGSESVSASKVAAVLRDASVPVVVLNACQSGAVGKDLEAAVATRLLREGAASVVGMAYSLYAVAAAEFMAMFYERLFAGDTVSAAVTAGRRRLFQHDLRPSPKGVMPLEDWLVPVHYVRREISFPLAGSKTATGQKSLDAALDELAMHEPARLEVSGSLEPAGVFVGRDDLIYKLEVAARQQRVVVLHGPGGAGKTELAKAFGRWWRDTSGVDRPEWVLWHSFEPGAASFGLDRVITEIGLTVYGTDFVRLDPGQQRELVESLLAERRLLLIWDNFETVRSMPDPVGATPPLDEAGCQEIRGFLSRLATRGKSAVIITSRTSEDWLEPARRIAVGGLSREDAFEYAAALLAPYPATAQRRARRAFGELLEWLNGHPLSMRLILPRLEIADPEALLDGLRGIAPLPGGNDPGGDRTASLAASISYSFTHLAESTRRLLPAISLLRSVADANLLAVFSQQPDVPARFAGASREEWTEVVGDAARVGLLAEIRGGMYEIHPALPSYLSSRWHVEDAAGYESAWDAATRAMTAASADFGTWLDEQLTSGDAATAYTVIGLHRRTLGFMLGYALDHQLWEYARAIAQPLRRYWTARGLDQEASVWTDRIQAVTEAAYDGGPPPLDSPAGALWLLSAGARAGRLQRVMRLDDAERAYRQILNLLDAQPVSPQRQLRIATAYHQLGMLAQDRGRLDEAEEWYHKSLEIRQGLEDRPGMATSFHQLGTIALLRGRLEDAEQFFRRSLEISEQLGNLPDIAASNHQLGVVGQYRGRLDEADDWYSRALAINERLGSLPGMADSFHQLGVVAQNRGRLEDAQEWYRKSLAIFDDLRNLPGMATSYYQLGAVAQDMGQMDEAEEWYRKSLAIAESLGNQPGMAASYRQLGNVAYIRGRLDEAEDWYRKSLAIDEELGNLPGSAASYHQLGIVAQDRRRLGEAEEWYRKSLAIKEGHGDRSRVAISYHQLGIVAQLQGRFDEAEDWYRKSLVIDEEFGNLPGAAASYHQLGVLAQERGQLDEAEDRYRKSLAIEESLGDRRAVAASYHQLGVLAQERGQLDEAEDWFRRSLAIFDSLGNRPGIVTNYSQLGRLAEQQGRNHQAMEWAVRSVTISGEFLEPLAFNQENLTRLATRLGSDALESTWEIVTGNPLPQAVRERLGSLQTANARPYVGETWLGARLPCRRSGWITPLTIGGSDVRG